MKRLFLDANILVAVFNKEYPLYSFAARVVSLADNPRFEIYTSPICLAITTYFSEKKNGIEQTRKKLELLFEHFHITEIKERTVKKALQNPKVEDFEDGMEYYAALATGCDVIITENVSDFYFAEIPVLNSSEFLESIR